MSIVPPQDDPAVHQESAERRRWVRTPAQATEITVVQERGTQTASVVDESYGGIGIRLREVAEIVRGQTLRMLYRGVPVGGTVRGVLLESEGQHRVGIEWLDTRRPNQNSVPRQRRKSSTYISFSGFLVACTTTDQRKNGHLDVVLPNGTVCHARVADVVTRTFEERMAELAKLKTELTMLLGIYELGEYDSLESAIKGVLEFEFAKETKADTAVLDELRCKNREILEQQERIHELESIVRCIVSLCERVRELEAEHA